MKILSIETSCDETAVAVLDNQKILSSVVSSQIEIHKKYGGVYPEMASRAHLENILPCIKTALKQAKIKLEQIDKIAVTTGPGLIGTLLIGVNTAKTLAYSLKKPIIGINHLEGHIYSVLDGVMSKLFPAIILIVSGGHTMLVLMKNHGQYKILGQTKDDAAGEAFDKVAKLIGLSYPGGPEIERLAKTGNTDFFNLPRAMIEQKNFDFSFSGLKTAVLNIVKQNTDDSIKKIRHHICTSFQQAVFDVLIVKTLRAAGNFKAKSILVAGGVSANSLLRKEFKLKIKNYKIKFFAPAKNLSTDNAVMIGIAAYFKFLKNKGEKWYNIEADANLKLKEAK